MSPARRRRVSSGAPWEQIAGYSRAVAAGDFIFVSGCTSIADGEVVHEGDMTRQTEQGVQNFSHGDIPLTGEDTADLQFGNWTSPSQGIPLVTTHDGQQTTQILTNQ